MDLLGRALTHLQPPYAGWVAPLVLENLGQLRGLLESHLSDGVVLDPGQLLALLDEVRGGFWAMGMEAAQSLAAKAAAFVGNGPDDLQMAGEHLLWAVEWLDDAALVAQMGYTPSPAPFLRLLEQWGTHARSSTLLGPVEHALLPLGGSLEHKAQDLEMLLRGEMALGPLPAHPGLRIRALLALAQGAGKASLISQAHPGLDLDAYVQGTYQAPSARAFLEIGRAVALEIAQTRELLDAWLGAKESANPASLNPVLERLGALGQGLRAIHPGLGAGVDTARDRLAQIAYNPRLESAEVQAKLVETGLALAQLEYQFLDVTMGGLQPNGPHTGTQPARQALRAIARAMTEQTTVVREWAAAGAGESGRETATQALTQLAGALSMLEAPALAEQTEALSRVGTGTAGERRTGAIVAMAEAWAQAASTHCPHVHALELATQCAPGLLPPADFLMHRARQCHHALAEIVPRWQAQPRAEATIALRRVFCLLQSLQAPTGHALPRMGSAGRALLDASLASLKGPDALVSQAIAQATDLLGEGIEAGKLDQGPVEAAAELLQASLAGAPPPGTPPGTNPIKPKPQPTAGASAWEMAVGQWGALPDRAREAFHDFISPHWPALGGLDGDGFQGVVALVQAALRVAGGTGLADHLTEGATRGRVDLATRRCLEFLLEERTLRGTGIAADRIVALLEETTRLAKLALARDDAAFLALLLREQAQLLSDAGYLTNP